MTRQQLGTCDGVGGRIAHPEGHACVHWKPVSRPKQMCSDCASYPCIEGCRCPCHRKPALPELLEKACDHECGYDQAHVICRCVKCGTTYPNKEATFLDRNREAQPEPGAQALLRRIEQTDQRGGLDQFTEDLLADVRRYLSARAGSSPAPSPAAIRKALQEHWLSQIECNHYESNDSSICACGWKSERGFNVGKAVEFWIDHVFERAGVTGNEGKDEMESRSETPVLGDSGGAGMVSGRAGSPLRDASLAPHAVVTGLRYIAESPAQEHGGFHPQAIKTAKEAITLIEELASKVAELQQELLTAAKLGVEYREKVSELEAQLQHAVLCMKRSCQICNATFRAYACRR